MGSIAIFAVCGLVFGSLTICDESDSLALPFAPLPVRRKAIRYADDGRGIPCVPGRGWTCNLWGFACVPLTLGRKIIREGTDDVEGLAKFLSEKIALSSRP